MRSQVRAELAAIEPFDDLEREHLAEEFDAVRWFRLNEVPLERSEPHMARFVAKLALAR